MFVTHSALFNLQVFLTLLFEVKLPCDPFCPIVGWLVSWSVGRSVCLSVMYVYITSFSKCVFFYQGSLFTIVWLVMPILHIAGKVNLRIYNINNIYVIVFITFYVYVLLIKYVSDVSLKGNIGCNKIS